MPSRVHTTQSFQEQNSNSRFVLSGCRSPALPTPVLLGSGWSGGFHGHRALGSCHSLCSLSDILKQVSTVYLCPGCSAPEPSVPREHQVDFTRTRTGWVCAHSIPSVVACCAACYRPTLREVQPLPRSRAGASHSSRSSPMALSHARHIPAAERARLGLHTRSRIPLLPQ